MKSREIPPTNGWLGGTTYPIQQHTSMQSIPWPPSYSLTSSTSILDPPWAWLTHLVPKTKWPGTVQTHPRTSRLLQLWPSTPGTSRPPKNCQKQYRTGTATKWGGNQHWITSWLQLYPHYWTKTGLGSTGSLQVMRRESTLDHQLTTPYPHHWKPKYHSRQYWNSMLFTENLEKSGDSENWPGPPVHRLGPPSWLTPTPQYVAHVCYLTTHKAPPETPCSTPFIWIRRPEWMVHPRGWRFLVSIQITPENPMKTETGPENTRFAQNKPDLTRWNSTSPKCVPDTHLPLGQPVNHD